MSNANGSGYSLLVPGVPLVEDRQVVVERGAAATEGFSGREIRNAMRTALPLGAVCSPPCVAWAHFESAIAQIRAANQNVGKRRPGASAADPSIEAGRSLLGMSDWSITLQLGDHHGMVQ